MSPKNCSLAYDEASVQDDDGFEPELKILVDRKSFNLKDEKPVKVEGTLTVSF